MIEIAICDDSFASVDKLKKALENFANKFDFKYIVHEIYSAHELLNFSLDKIDILFLDVEIDKESGIELAREIRKMNAEILIIFVSGFIQYAPAGYNVKAFRYLLKCDLDNLFEDTMEAALKDITFREEFFEIKSKDFNVLIPLKNIVFIESYYGVVDVHVKDMLNNKYETPKRIKDIYENLAHKGFLQIHKSYIVNMDNIVKIKNYKVFLSDGTVLNASQRNWSELISKYISWRGKF